MVAANAECALIFSLSPGNSGDAPEGRKLLTLLGSSLKPCRLLMDRAYEGNETQRLSRELGFIPVVPPNPNRLKPWIYDKELYKKRNEIERLFRRLKGFRRVFTRFDKLDVMYLAFVVFALIFEALK
jgi:transposase